MDAETATDADITAAMEAMAVKALDDTTLEVTLANPAPHFISKIGTIFMGPVRLDVIEAAGELYDSDYTTHVWCGPFVVSEFVKDNSMTVEQYLASAAKSLGGAITFKDAIRFEKGEGIEKKQENFAEEIASMVKG